jgi:hypothetical protein
MNFLCYHISSSFNKMSHHSFSIVSKYFASLLAVVFTISELAEVCIDIDKYVVDGITKAPYYICPLYNLWNNLSDKYKRFLSDLRS